MSSFNGSTKITTLAFIQCIILLVTQAEATTRISSHWTRADASVSVIKAEHVSQRSRLSCAEACLPPQCPRFAFRQLDGSCLLENPINGTPASLGEYLLYEYDPLDKCRKDLGYVYDPAHITCIFHKFVKRTWYQSRDLCVSHGAHLYDIQDHRKWSALQAYFSQKGIIPRKQWIGATDEIVDGQWKWTDGTDAKAMLSDKWLAPNPDNVGPMEEDYVWVSGSNFSMYDKSVVDRGEGVICEIDMV